MFEIDFLRERFTQTLPGLAAQMNMAPPSRGEYPVIPNDVKIGGVMLLLSFIDKEWHTILIRRTEDGHTHSGQISFPGGKKDKFDADITQTALRECEEEIGIRPADIEVIGTLTPLYIPPSNFMVTATVGVVQNLLSLKLSEKEVQEVIRAPLSLLYDKATKGVEEVIRSDDKRTRMKTPVYKLADNITIWGATAMMLAEFEVVWNEAFHLTT